MNPKDLSEIARRVDSRETFLEFVAALRAEWELARAEEAANPSPSYGPRARDWENFDLGSYLNAMAAWLETADGYYKNTNQTVSSSAPSWRLFTDMLMAASVYE